MAKRMRKKLEWTINKFKLKNRKQRIKLLTISLILGMVITVSLRMIGVSKNSVDILAIVYSLVMCAMIILPAEILEMIDHWNKIKTSE